MATNSWAADHRPDRRGGVLTRTLQTYLESLPAATAADVLRGLEETVAPSADYRCMNPTCEELCAWPSGYAAGRPTRFCSRRCRQIFDRVKARLEWEVDKLQSFTIDPSLTGKERYVLLRAVSQRRWALIRYPSSVGSEESVS